MVVDAGIITEMVAMDLIETRVVVHVHDHTEYDIVVAKIVFEKHFVFLFYRFVFSYREHKVGCLLFLDLCYIVIHQSWSDVCVSKMIDHIM
jgi:hypothetical protein